MRKQLGKELFSVLKNYDINRKTLVKILPTFINMIFNDEREFDTLMNYNLSPEENFIYLCQFQHNVSEHFNDIKNKLPLFILKHKHNLLPIVPQITVLISKYDSLIKTNDDFIHILAFYYEVQNLVASVS